MILCKQTTWLNWFKSGHHVGKIPNPWVGHKLKGPGNANCAGSKFNPLTCLFSINYILGWGHVSQQCPATCLGLQRMCKVATSTIHWKHTWKYSKPGTLELFTSTWLLQTGFVRSVHYRSFTRARKRLPAVSARKTKGYTAGSSTGQYGS